MIVALAVLNSSSRLNGAGLSILARSHMVLHQRVVGTQVGLRKPNGVKINWVEGCGIAAKLKARSSRR
jgi:uncharacterized membrane protein (DUF441 family)